MNVRSLAALLAALLAAPLAASARQGQGAAPSASAPAPEKVPAVPQATAATLAPAAPPPRAPSVKVLAVPPASSAAKPVLTRHAPPGPAPKESWRGDGRPASGVAPGALARAAARTQQARAPEGPSACKLPPSRRAPRIECPPATEQIESIEIDWSAPASR